MEEYQNGQNGKYVRNLVGHLTRQELVLALIRNLGMVEMIVMR